jgi:hypothetical protein
MTGNGSKQTTLDAIAEFTNGGANINNLNQDILNALEVPLPPLRVQRRIAGVLSAYDELIENCQRRIRILESMARALYREWFVHFRFPGHEKIKLVPSALGDIPKDWEVKPFSALASYVNGYAFKPAQLGTEGKPVIKIKELKAGIVADTPRNLGKEIPEKYRINDGDVLFSWSADLNAYLWMGGEGLLNQHLFNVLPVDGLSLVFCFHALKEAMPRFRALSLGATTHHIKRSALDQVFTVVAPAETRKQFEVLVEPMHLQLVTLTKRITNLCRTRDLLLPRMLSEQVALNVAEDELETEVAPMTAAESEPVSYPPSEPQILNVAETPKSARSADSPPPIDDTDRTEVNCLIRQVFSDGVERDRASAIQDIARALGYRRTGARIREILSDDLLTAVRRGIVVNENGGYTVGFKSVTECTRDSLKEDFLSAIGRAWTSRDDAIRAFARWLAFARTGEVIEKTARSLINGLIRDGRLEVDGNEWIRRSFQ